MSSLAVLLNSKRMSPWATIGRRFAAMKWLEINNFLIAGAVGLD